MVGDKTFSANGISVVKCGGAGGIGCGGGGNVAALLR